MFFISKAVYKVTLWFVLILKKTHLNIEIRQFLVCFSGFYGRNVALFLLLLSLQFTWGTSVRLFDHLGGLSFGYNGLVQFDLVKWVPFYFCNGRHAYVIYLHDEYIKQHLFLNIQNWFMLFWHYGMCILVWFLSTLFNSFSIVFVWHLMFQEN